MSVVLEQESERIRLRMASLRKSMNYQAARVAHSTQQLFDWKEQLKQYPRALVAAGVLAGFLISPGRKVTPTVRLSQQSVDEIITQNRPQPKQEPSLQAMVVSGALRALTAVALTGFSAVARKGVERFLAPGESDHVPHTRPQPERSGNAAGTT